MIVKIIRQPQRSCGQRFVQHARHLGNFRRRRDPVPSVHAHCCHSDREMADKHRVIGRQLDLFQDRLLVFRPSPPIPGNIVYERLERDVLEEREYLDHLKPGFRIVRQRRSAEAAIAVDDGRCPIAGQWIQIALEPHRRVVMRMAFDEAGRHMTAPCIEHCIAVRRKIGAYFSDQAITDTDVCFKGRCTSPVNDSTALDQHASHTSLLCVRMCRSTSLAVWFY
jgi:hypothetical protein